MCGRSAARPFSAMGGWRSSSIPSGWCRTPCVRNCKIAPREPLPRPRGVWKQPRRGAALLQAAEYFVGAGLKPGACQQRANKLSRAGLAHRFRVPLLSERTKSSNRIQATEFKQQGGKDFMSTALVSEGRKLKGAGNGNGQAGNGHGAPGPVSGKATAHGGESTPVLDEIMRLVDASKDGRLSERGQATLFSGVDREVIQGVNEMLDAILLPIAEGNRILSQISLGKIDELIA